MDNIHICFLTSSLVTKGMEHFHIMLFLSSNYTEIFIKYFYYFFNMIYKFSILVCYWTYTCAHTSFLLDIFYTFLLIFLNPITLKPKVRETFSFPYQLPAFSNF